MAGTGKKFQFFGSFKTKKEAVKEEEKHPGTFVLHPKNAAKGLSRYFVVRRKK